EVLPLSQSPGLSLRRTRGESAGPDRAVPDGAPQQRHRLSAHRGEHLSQSPDERMAELRELFFESAQELLQVLNDEALKLEKSPDDAEVVRSIRRMVHTLKGDSAACGYRELSELAHEMEDALALGNVSVDLPLAEVAFTAADVFGAMLA